MNRECVYNVSVSIEERIRNRNDWKLYLSDHYWVLDMDDCMEFYLHPLHFLGKISKSELPPRVTDNICKHCKCFTDADRKNTEYQATLQSTPLRLRNLDHTMKIGNWFYAQGHNYVTLDGKFICDDPYFEGRERICDIGKLSWNYVYDMLRMTSSTKTHHYLRTLYDLPCFYGVSSTDLVIRPLLDFQWNSQQWKYDFEECTRQIRRYGDEKAMTILRYMRKEVFQHTVFLARQGSYEASNGKKTALPDSDKMRSETVLYDKKLPRNIEPRFSATTITVENIDCLVAARHMQNRGLNPAVLNMANRQTPGGGVFAGAGAQEENLFRRTNLFQSMYQYAPFAQQYGITPAVYQYPMERNHGGVYSPDVVVFRGEEKDGYPLLDDYYQVAVISVAAMNRPSLTPLGKISPDLIEGVKNKIRTILNIGILHGHDSLVLSAFGCGAFRNPPEHMAQLFHEVIREEYSRQFREICFAIIEDHNSGGSTNPNGNYLPFYNEFR